MKFLLSLIFLASCATAEPAKKEIKTVCYEDLNTNKIIEIPEDQVVTADKVRVSCKVNTGTFNCLASAEEIKKSMTIFCKGPFIYYGAENTCKEGFQNPALYIVFRCYRGDR